MRLTISLTAILTIAANLVLAVPAPQDTGTALTLWNGQQDIVTYYTNAQGSTSSDASSVDAISPSHNLTTRDSIFGPKDVIDCKGQGLCNILGGPNGQCASAARLIINGNIYSTTGNAGRTGVCQGSTANARNCGIFVSGPNCQVTGADLLQGYNEIRTFGCSDCGKVTLASNGCQIKVDKVSFC